MLLICMGTRPEKLKLEPLFRYWKKNKISDYGIFISGQHIDTWNECVIDNWEFKDKIINIDFPNPMIQEDVSNRLDNVIIQCMKSFSNVLDVLKPEYVLIQGDTATAYACALSAFQYKVKIIHLEAGLRSYDKENPYPEEFYRRSISIMTDIHLCPTYNSFQNLRNENIYGVFAPIVGNTILDSLGNKKPNISNKILCTLHRRENIPLIKEWFESLDYLAGKYQEYEFILPIHKNPVIYQYKDSFKYVKCIDPLEHNELIDLLKDCYAVITDSGGIVEEATWFKKPIFLCRKETERPEAASFYIWVYLPKDLRDIDIINVKSLNLNIECPFGDGKSSQKITKIFKSLSIF